MSIPDRTSALAIARKVLAADFACAENALQAERVTISSAGAGPGGRRYVRPENFLEPFHIMTGPYGPNPTRNWRAWVPIDLTWKLRPNIKWHDGTPFTSEDMLFTYTLYKDPALPTLFAGQLQMMASASAPDPQTFIVHWSKTYVYAHRQPALEPMPKHLLGEAYAAGDKAFLTTTPKLGEGAGGRGFSLLTKEDNELITRVGPGTAMGDMMRQYWHPFLFPYELDPDGAPLRIRLLGEDLIAYRDTQGRVGLLADSCAHRGASLFFGRNEEDGLRCVYHGWKYDVTGACVEMPNEPAESNFKDKIRHTAHPCVEHGGVVWTYMGRLDPPPPLPNFEFTRANDDQRFLWKRVQTCNWVQAMEGDIDQSHNSFLHTYLNPETDNSPRSRITQIRAADRSPHFETVNTDYGVCIAARRAADDDTYYIRISQYLMPYHTMTGPYGENPTRGWRAWVPIDDEHTLVIGTNFHPLDKLPDRSVRQLREGYRIRGSVFYVEPEDRATVTSGPFGAWHTIDSLENDLRIDREVQKKLTFSGIPVFWAQDGGTQLTMGKIQDRTKEHLGTTDRGIVAARRRLISAARALRDEGATPPGVLNPDWYDIRAAAVEILRDVDWFEASEEYRRVIPGLNQAGV